MPQRVSSHVSPATSSRSHSEASTVRFLAGVIAAVLLGGSALLAASPASAVSGARPVSAVALAAPQSTTPTDVFAGQVERVQQLQGQAGRPRFLYTVHVLEVYGESAISTARVMVHSSAVFARCDNRPRRAAGTLYAFAISRQGERLTATRCADVREIQRDDRDTLVRRYGDARPPVPEKEPEPPLPAVAYECPETGDAISGPSAAASECDEVGAVADLDRSAAPGLALTLIGLLGLVVVRRAARR
ncbi:hypothetical protein [Nocardioides sp. R-C-SC26]|uniref:hypothetical protein n=1 Tax=Nocardioides sp. R-C-SC26 TaxID=2870414 RepID=UPI001E291816|nr:hypothetical protein [Nocardioides sp. R-C-SC26]